VRLVEQWSEIQAALPQGWQRTSVVLELADPQQADRAAVVLGPAAPWRVGSSFRLDVVRQAGAVGADPGLVERTLARLDAEGIAGRLSPAGAAHGTESVEQDAQARALALDWQELVDALPPDWSHALVRVHLDSSDYVDRAALLLAPANPRLVDGRSTLEIRVARRIGYGISAEMLRRCLERLDHESITGRLELVQAVSDAHPVSTQGPVFRVGGRSV
jgi:hypothetical protein